MVTFKISSYDLYHNQWDYVYDPETQTGEYKNSPLNPGIRVCSVSKLSNMGIITHLGEEVEIFKADRYHPGPDRTYTKEVTVLWLAGSKKGKTEIKETKLLSNFDAYRKAVEAHLAELDKIESEAAKTGM